MRVAAADECPCMRARGPGVRGTGPHSEVGELESLEVGGEEQVGGLHVAVHHGRRAAVEVLERAEHLRRVPQGAGARRPPRRGGYFSGGGGFGAGSGVDVEDGAGLHELEDLPAP